MSDTGQAKSDLLSPGEFRITDPVVRAIQDIENSCFDHPWNGEQILDELNHGDSITILYTDNNEIIEPKSYAGEVLAGYASGRVMVFENTVDILRIAVLPDHRRKGVGKIILKKLEEICLEFLDRPTFFMLEVSELNTAAIHLYGSSGYKIIHRRKSYYQDSSSALIMRKDVRNNI